jgi:hypothetical protein
MHFDPPHTFFMATAEHQLRVRDAHNKAKFAAGDRTIRRRRPRPVTN